MTQNISRLNNANDSIKQGAPKVGEGSDYQLVTPMMQLYLPRVEARLRGITALKAMSQVRQSSQHPMKYIDNKGKGIELAYTRHVTQST